MQITEMERWLTERLGAVIFSSAVATAGARKACRMRNTRHSHFLNIEAAKAFVDRFADIAHLAVGADSDRPD